jgi:hypothetical protein
MYQISGVMMGAFTSKVKDIYYGRLDDIWELDYSGQAKNPMF